MAIYYINVQIIGRSAGRTATGAAAYRAGERIVDERTGQVWDYTRRQGEIETQILAPEGAPAWAHDREQLWNHVEAAERRGDAQLAREIVVAFPIELNPDQQRELIREYVQSQFVSQGMAADVAIHRNPGNPHAHIMLTMREMTPDGLASKKNREWNKPEQLERWREEWANHANRELERAGRPERIDHRSLEAQGLERLPQVHLGPHASALERQGIPTDLGDHNRLVAEHNAVVVDLEKARQEKARLEAERITADRYAARLQSGWLVPHAQALAQLEREQGGGQLSHQQTTAILSEAQRGLSSVQAEMDAIRVEGRRLQEAAGILSRREQAAAEVERLKAPLAAVRRWFSREARDEFRQAVAEFEALDRGARELGTPTDAELQAQRVTYQHEHARLPELAQQAERHTKTISLASRAVDGFREQAYREYERVHARERERGRGYERDR